MPQIIIKTKTARFSRIASQSTAPTFYSLVLVERLCVPLEAS